MEKFLHDFADALPIFVCVADKDSNQPVYCNKMALVYMDSLSEEEKYDFIKEASKCKHFLKYCENIAVPSGGHWLSLDSQEILWIDGEERFLITGIDYSKNIETNTDEMTGVHNRDMGYGMLSKFINELNSAKTVQFTVCYIKLNAIYVNNQYDKVLTDDCIVAVTSIVKQTIRQSDVFARLDYHDFLLIFPSCKESVAETIMDNILKILLQTDKQVSLNYGILEVRPNSGYNIQKILEITKERMDA
ncbi:MAG: GGDEF domain-containing protein [Turicibacter sp.]|nr:GGDEF domain-containing protein [Turicibacter sp.]